MCLYPVTWTVGFPFVRCPRSRSGLTQPRTSTWCGIMKVIPQKYSEGCGELSSTRPMSEISGRKLGIYVTSFSSISYCSNLRLISNMLFEHRHPFYTFRHPFIMKILNFAKADMSKKLKKLNQSFTVKCPFFQSSKFYNLKFKIKMCIRSSCYH